MTSAQADEPLGQAKGRIERQNAYNASDWGGQRAVSVAQHSHNWRHAMCMRILLARAAAVVLQLLACGAAAEEVASFPILVNQPLTVIVEVNDIARLFLLDTGCWYTAIDESIIPVLASEKLDDELPMLGDVKEWRSAPRLKLGNAAITVERVAVRDLKPMRRAASAPIAGVLGMDALKTFVLEIDPNGSECRIHKGSVRVKDPSITKEINMDRSGRPFVKAEICNTPRPFMIDTGSDMSVMLDTAIFDHFEKHEALKKVFNASKSLNLSDIYTLETARCREFSLGDEVVEDIVVTRAPDEAHVAGIGMGMWCRFQVVLDFPAQRLFANPSKLFAGRDVLDHDEMEFARGDGSIFVVSVNTKGRGWLFGARPGDEIIGINQNSIRDLGHAVAHSQLSMPRTKALTIRIRRGPQTLGMMFER